MIHYLIMIIGVLLCLMAVFEGYHTSLIVPWVISLTGFLTALFAGITSRYSNKGLHWATIVLAISLCGQAILVNNNLFWITLIVGIVSLLLLLFTLRLKSDTKNFILHAQDGSTLMEIRKLEFKDENLIIRGKMMGTMPTVARMQPEEVWKAISLIPPKVLLGFPAYLFKAWKTGGNFSNNHTKTQLY